MGFSWWLKDREDHALTGAETPEGLNMNGIGVVKRSSAVVDAKRTGAVSAARRVAALKTGAARAWC
ncbi:hypothetical protein [uncultured Aquimonas sp.]|uniref:hypothetical protein n=1 Tax=uncultured Aquimonas sp. TaxID=385483 RepID=UPI001AD5B688|nr:hypothetical protein [uncultured Aquimonas sp.]MBN9459714.1 hypothetical protein [Burkholderiales bacterium]